MFSFFSKRPAPVIENNTTSVIKRNRSPIKTTYDNYNYEIQQIITPNFFTGLRAEISKSISSFCQFSTIKTQESTQNFLTLSTKETIFQFSFDSNKNYQVKSSVLTGPFISKFHTIISRKKDIYSQFETILNSKFYNLCFKLISPTFEATNLIYIVNCFTKIGFITWGFEVIGLNKEVGLSLSTRIENENNVICANLQKFNTLTVSFYQRMMNLFEIGGEVVKSRERLSYSGGIRIKNHKSEVKGSVSSNGNLYFDWCENLTENLKVEFSMNYDWDEMIYGIGLNFED